MIPQIAQARAEHAWISLSTVGADGIRAAHYLHGPIGGVTSQNGFTHTMEVSLDQLGVLTVKVDGRPISPYLCTLCTCCLLLESLVLHSQMTKDMTEIHIFTYVHKLIHTHTHTHTPVHTHTHT